MKRRNKCSIKIEIKHFIDWFTYRGNGDFHNSRNLVPPSFWFSLFLISIFICISVF